MKYIDAEKLIANLERQNTDKKIIEPLIRIITSLQQEKPEVDLDAEVDRFYRSDEYKMSHELGRGFEAIAYHFYDLGCRRTAVMYDDIEYERQRAEEAEITKGLEEELKRYINSDEYINTRESGYLLVARHFAEWGRKKVLQEIYDGKVKPVDKITAAWFDNEQST